MAELHKIKEDIKIDDCKNNESLKEHVNYMITFGFTHAIFTKDVQAERQEGSLQNQEKLRYGGSKGSGSVESKGCSY